MNAVLIIALIVAAIVAYETMEGAQGPTTIAGWASNAGFSGVDLVTAVAIAYAESSGNPNAVGDVNLGRSIGLWQINLAAHPEYSENELYDPQTNANAAFDIYSAAGNSFSPWTTFKTGAYSQYEDAAQAQSADYEDDNG